MNGEQHRIEGHGYDAVIAEVGGALRELRHAGRDLVVPFDADEVRPVYRGVVAVPWPNRIGDGRYDFAGTTHRLPLNEPERLTALHGLAMWDTWELADRRASSVVLTHRLNPRDGYPWMLDLEVIYTLGPSGLGIELCAVNAGRDAAPYGCTVHPYLRAGDGVVDDWLIEVPAAQYLDVTPDRLLPIGLRDVDGTPFDLRGRLGSRVLDHALTAITPDEDGWATARLVAADGHGVRIRWDAASPWVQVFTSDWPGTPLHRGGVAIEPMTCPPDAFTTGTDVVVLDPGAAHTARWEIGADDS